ncbi:UPF0692 protein C19orf54 homolog isoform X6 [Trachypithecus francoisi]|uniref:UPF0692 protein C19orf54 homolog isoform X6 n=1 Tax=Trachypithecus francoisi TaxID=54180 RepID=UPI00141B2219|nr:UPF0692 protein C19orf54 homolog isoform X6 [Trachypithecus francoisi]
MLSSPKTTNPSSKNPCTPSQQHSISSSTPKSPGLFSFTIPSLESADRCSPTTPTASSTRCHGSCSPSCLRPGEEPAPEGGLGEGWSGPQGQRRCEEAPETAQGPMRAGGLVDGRYSPVAPQWRPPGETRAGGHGKRLHSPGRDVLSTSYDEDFNHEPCQRKGHKAHWAVSAGVLLGVRAVPSLGYAEDPELPGLFHPVLGTPCQPPSLPEEGSPGAVYLLSKQGKSWHYQLWDYDQVRDSNLQLTDFSPSRATDGRVYVVPVGGVRAGLCGQALLLTPQDCSH